MDPEVIDQVMLWVVIVVLVGHGIGVAPSLFALIAQPPVALVSIGITWLIALALICGIPALREHQNRWPPSLQELFIDGGATASPAGAPIYRG